MNVFLKLTLERCLRAAIAAACGSLSVGFSNPNLNMTGTKAVLIGAVAAAVSAAISTLSTLFGPDPNSTSFTNTTVQQ